ncbi:hypothetical protein CROQUDRAFT_650726 [Cronartium quercuum f. sp. fusiforme G11]|uniref:Uncharacterized protein n=1 Tax=Cronartium quercuum f. sp. fusiforme G11 TaxID=708437 RepID=A0A9P6NY89_9BASI|nr:hypothetical protein CROQUDRAFT_650726 [Cronartium quercuum f. sp. fusiforme G11]
MVNKNDTKMPSGVIEKTSVTPTNSTSGGFPKKTEFPSESQGVSAGMIALVVLLLAFLGAIIGLFFWRRRRKSQAERRNAAAGMEEVVTVPPGDGKGDEKTIDGEKFGLDSSRSSGVDETENSNFGRKGIMRSSRPTSLCLNEALQQAKIKTNILAIPQTPSQQSHGSSKQSHQISPSNRPPGPRYDPGYAAYLRPTRPPNRPASWRSSIAVAWANLGIPTRLLDPSGRMSPGGGSIERDENGRPSPGSRNPFKGLYPGLSRAPSKPQNRMNGMTNLWKNERVSQVITEEEEEDRSTILSESDTASSTHHTESLKTSSTSGPPSSRKSIISTDPSTSASGDSSHSGTMSFGGVELSARETSNTPKSNTTPTASPSNQIRRVEDEVPVEVVVHAI